MASTDRFKPGDLIEYRCRDERPAAPTGGWVPGTFQRYLPWPAGHSGGPDGMKAIVIPQGLGDEAALTVPISELRFPPPPPRLDAGLGAPAEPGEAMPAAVNGMPVVSAFRIPPGSAGGVLTWRVILRDDDPERGGRAGTVATYTVTRACWVSVAPGIADGEWRDIDQDGNEGFRGLPWTIAARTFARMTELDAQPRDED
jgi:hypothetical protein